MLSSVDICGWGGPGRGLASLLEQTGESPEFPAVVVPPECAGKLPGFPAKAAGTMSGGVLLSAVDVCGRGRPGRSLVGLLEQAGDSPGLSATAAGH